jgi:hypothetical protein
MDINDSLLGKHAPLLSAIKASLRDVPGASDLLAREDFDRDGVILFSPKASKSKLRFFLSREFLEDFTPDDIMARLRYYRVADKLRSLPPRSTLFVTTEGTFTEPSTD